MDDSPFIEDHNEPSICQRIKQEKITNLTRKISYNSILDFGYPGDSDAADDTLSMEGSSYKRPRR
jgi:hypothetical protein